MESGSGRRFRTRQERRRIVEETLKPGASVSLVARANDVNANQVFHWRRQYREGWFEEAEPAGSLIPVRIASASNKPAPATGKTSKTIPSASGTIEIDLGHARVRIEGADAECIRAALEGLRR
jgi:transposase